MACLTASCGSRCWRTGFQTFGDDYAIDKPTMEITVKMKRPQGQYSIYEDHPETRKTSRSRRSSRRKIRRTSRSKALQISDFRFQIETDTLGICNLKSKISNLKFLYGLST